MSDNVIKSSDVNQKPKESATKKTAPKATAKVKVESEKGLKAGHRIVVFESGASYTSNGIRFTRDNHIQEVPESDAEILLQQENFRLPTQFEVDDYLASKED